MSLLRFNVKGQQIFSDTREVVVANSVDYLKASFTFSPEWAGLTKTAIFKTEKGVAYGEVLVNDECTIPHEVIKPKYMKVSVFGVTSAGVKLVPTTERIVHVSVSGYELNVVPTPTPNVYQQMVTIMETQAVDATRAETAQEEAEQAERTAKSHAEQTGEDRIATGEDRVATGADRSAVNTALLGFAETTLPAAIESVENKADSEIIRVGQAGDAQVQAVEQAGGEQIQAVELSGAEQTAAATAQANRAEQQADRADSEADKSTTQATKSESYAVGGTGSREGENEDNSKHYSGISLQAMTDFLAMLGKDIATLTDGKLTPSQIPALSINDVFDVASEVELLTLTAERGDCALVVADDVVTDSYILAADDPTEMSNWKKLGISYVANAGHAVTADNATNADKINNKRIVSMTQAQYDIAALDDDTYYYVDPEPDEPEV